MDQSQIDEFNRLTGSTFVWHELNVPDAEAAVEFYTSSFGFGHQPYDMGEMGTYHLLTKNGVGICGVFSTNTPQMQGTPPHWAVYMAVEDVDAKITECESKGCKTVVPAMDVPTVGRMALISDPQGAHFWVFKPNPATS